MATVFAYCPKPKHSMNSEESSLIQPDPTKNDESFSKTIDLPVTA
jgi:hypothetical protein